MKKFALFFKNRKFLTLIFFLSLILAYPTLIITKEIFIIDKNSKIIKSLKNFKISLQNFQDKKENISPQNLQNKKENISPEKLNCLDEKDIIKSAWHCINKEIFPANEFLYDYYSAEIETFKLPGGYIELFKKSKIIGTNGKGEMFIYNPKEKSIKSHPSNLDDIYEDQKFKVFRSNTWGRFGVKDIYLDEENNQIYASLTVDTNGKGCYGMAIYKADFIFNKRKNLKKLNFKEFFKTDACNENFGGHGGGGRIDKFNEDIIFTVGSLDFEAEIINPDQYLPEKSSNSLGKVISINPSGEYKVLSKGHRNPQGLVVIRDKIFITEHGPKGGDEINIIEGKNHYGWPFYSYGVEYDDTLRYRYPHAGRYQKPSFYFTPSIAVSQIIFYQGDEFPYWKNKFLVTSLKYKSLFLMDFDFENNKFISSERIEIDHRIRDLELSSEGEIIIITDDQKILNLSRPENDFLKETNQWDLPI